ncbi:hypothetical protein [Francisella-like endosymbiont]|uniref:hypothetical protein n=1 Tax=Francisella-like endosymbiont TaxID=512373 RepID=UPI0031CCD905
MLWHSSNHANRQGLCKSFDSAKNINENSKHADIKLTYKPFKEITLRNFLDNNIKDEYLSSPILALIANISSSNACVYIKDINSKYVFLVKIFKT